MPFVALMITSPNCVAFEEPHLPGLTDDLLLALERLWSASAPLGSDWLNQDLIQTLGQFPDSANPSGNHPEGDRCPACHAHLPIHQHTPRDLGRHIFTIAIRDFMDPLDLSDEERHEVLCECVGPRWQDDSLLFI